MESIVSPSQLSPEKMEIIHQLLDESEYKVNEASQTSATQAFNLGCTIGLIPAALIVLITYIATQSWLAALLSGILMTLALIGLANLVALTARTRTIERIYKQEISPEAERILAENDISQAAFTSYIWDHMAPTATLWPYLPKPPVPEEPPKKKFRLRKPIKR